MKKYGKSSKLMAVCLALMLIVGMIGATAFAIERNETGTITVNDVEDGLTVSAYRLMDVKVSDNGQPQDPVYAWVDEVATWVRTNYSNYIGKDNDNSVQSAFNSSVNADEIAEFYDALAEAIRGGDITNFTAAKTVQSTGGMATLSDMTLGNYLILIENGMKVYRPSAVNLVPEWDETAEEWKMSDAAVEVKSSEPAIKKTVTDDTKKKDNFNISDTVNFTIVTDVPQFPSNAPAKEYWISDILPEGLTLDASTVKAYGVKDGAADTELTVGTAYTESKARPNGTAGVGGDTATDFTLDFEYEEIKGYKQIKVTYSAILNDKAALGENGNTNNAILDYSNNPYDGNTWKNKTDSATVYTYGLDISKVKKGETGILLAGAEFELYASADDAKNGTNKISFVKESDGVYRRALTTDDTSAVVTTLKVGETEDSTKGKLTIKGLDEQAWYLKEIVAPGGYNKLASPVEVTITDLKGGELDGKIANGNQEITGGLLPVTVENDDGFKLPTTGGIGTILFTAVGVALMGAGLVLLLVIRRKKTDSGQ